VIKPNGRVDPAVLIKPLRVEWIRERGAGTVDEHLARRGALGNPKPAPEQRCTHHPPRSSGDRRRAKGEGSTAGLAPHGYREVLVHHRAQLPISGHHTTTEWQSSCAK